MSSDSNNSRWKVLGSGQVVDSTSLAEDIAKLQIGDGAELSMPSQAKRSSVVLQVQETSPLETGSDASLGSNSPSQNNSAFPHSRESSTGAGSTESAGRQSLKINTGSEKGRGQQFVMDPARSVAHVEQPAFPSLASQHQPKLRQQPNLQTSFPRGDIDFQQGRHFPLQPQPGMAPFVPAGVARGEGSSMMPFRQPARAVYNQPVLPGNPGVPPNFSFTPGHHPHLSMNNSQQLYDMMLPDLNVAAAALAAAQQQAAFRGNHQHSASDPASLRDAATLALLGGASFPPQLGPGMYPPQALSMYTASAPFYPAVQREAYAQQAQEMARVMQQAALQPQYTGMSGYDSVPQSPPPSSTQTGHSNGPSANNRKLGLYKTELCRNWEEKGSCRYGQKCQFAHGEEEIRNVPRHPKYKTEICRTFWVSGSCPYGKRCCFIHTELPSSGHPPGADGTPPPTGLETHIRSTSTGSDPDQPVSLLQRIRNQDGGNTPTATAPSTGVVTPKTPTPPSAAYGLTRPGALRVDTSSLDASANLKQNKSAYPTFAANGVLMSTEAHARSPGPVTAGPEFGQQSRLRGEVVGLRLSTNSPLDSSPRHSFHASDMNTITSPVSATGPGPTFAAGVQTPAMPASAVDNISYTYPRAQGHTRSGSAGNWKGFTARGSHLAPPSPYSHSPNSIENATNSNSNVPWLASSDLSSNTARSKDVNKAWA